MTSLRRLPIGIAFALAVVITGSARGASEADDTDDENFREEVLVCEEAVAKLGACCPDVDWSTVGCNYRHTTTGGCSDGTIDFEDPALNLSESRCILGTPCEQIQKGGVCTRAKAARPYLSKVRRSPNQPDTDLGSRSHPPVCP